MSSADQGFDHLPVGANTHGFMLWSELNPFLVVQGVGQVEMRGAWSGILFAEFH